MTDTKIKCVFTDWKNDEQALAHRTVILKRGPSNEDGLPIVEFKHPGDTSELFLRLSINATRTVIIITKLYNAEAGYLNKKQFRILIQELIKQHDEMKDE